MKKKRFSKKLSALIVICLGSSLLHAADTPLATRLKTVTGAEHVKVVYAKSQGGHTTDFPPTQDYNTDDYLMGINSDVGVEETLQTTKGNYQNPLITHDGTKVVFSDLSATPVTTYIVDWAKNATRRKIASGMTACLWFDATIGKEYAIYAKNGGHTAGPGTVFKVDLNDTVDSKLAFSGQAATYTQWLRISANGKAFGGCMGSYSAGGATFGVYDSVGERITSGPVGCWPSMPYDNTYRITVVSGDHNAWRIGGPDFTVFLDLLSGGGNMFSQCRMASYLPNLFLIVVNAADNDNGTGDIQVVRTDASLQHIQDTVTVTTGSTTHYADVWTSALTSAVKRQPSSRIMLPQKTGPVEYYSISGKRIAGFTKAQAAGKLPKGVYIRTSDNHTISRMISVVK